VNDDDVLERLGLPPVQVRGKRELKERFVMVYVTNGIEILEARPWTLTVVVGTMEVMR